MNGFIECFFIMAALAKLSSQTVKEEKTRSHRNKVGGLNLSDSQEWGSARLNFLWPLPHWHTDSLNNMQTIECAFPCTLHEIQRNLINDFRQTRERRTSNNMLKHWFVHATSVVSNTVQELLTCLSHCRRSVWIYQEWAVGGALNILS